VEAAWVNVVGRDAELAAVADFATSRTPGARALLLVGDAGFGKTTLWREAVDAFRHQGARVCLAGPAESERDLPFAALHDLLAVLLDELGGELSEPRRSALDAALLRSASESAADRLAVALAVLDLLRVASRDRTLVLAIDDVQWLDRPSAAALEFSLRRLESAPVSLLGTLRADGTGGLLGLAADSVLRVDVGPLPAAALRQIVEARSGLRLTRPSLLRLAALSGGSPFFALEIAPALEGEPREGDVLRLPRTLAEVVHGRLAALSAPTRDALLTVAALGRPTTGVFEVAIPDHSGVLAEGIETGVLELAEGRVRFTHPILASAVYSEAPPQRRRATHRALARAVDDPGERAVHLARGTETPDEGVAVDLERAALEAAARGAPETAAELAAHARRLTPREESEAAARRGLAAAAYMWSAGDGHRSKELLTELIAQLPPSPLRARARQLLVKIIDDISASISQLELGLDEARADPALAASVLNLLARQRTWAGDSEGAIRDARAALALAEAAGARAELALALARQSVARVYAGEPTPHDLLGRAVALERQLAEPVPVGESPTLFRGICALWDDDLETARSDLESVDGRAASLAESWRAIVLTHLADLELRCGNPARALAHVSEAEEIGGYWGVGHAEATALAAAAVVKAIAGDADEARRSAVRALDIVRPAGYEVVVRPAERALGLVELSLGNAAAAHDVLGPLLARAPIGSPAVSAAAPDEIEALLELGRVDDAKAVLARLETFARATGRPRPEAGAARSAALVAATEGDFVTAGEAITRALDAHRRFPDPFELGRTQFVQGIVERRRKRKASAREALTGALERFEAIGAKAWAERALAEMRRTSVRRSSPGELTPTERQVAKLAAGGATNREIAERMFISVKTVEANLSRVYGKLGVRSRTELASSSRLGAVRGRDR
jgi:DNA-binding CsgD family transcriptional regulator